MAEILTQKDIDALLRGITPEQRSAADVVPYNFVRPPRVSRDRRSALDAVHLRLALSLQGYLMSRLRSTIDVTVAGVEQVQFSEFLLSLASPCAAFVFKVGGAAEGHGVIDLGSEFAYYLVDRLFGGPGEPEKVERALSPLEQTVVRSVTDRMLGVLREAWQEQLAIAPEISGFESDPETLQIANHEDHVLVASLEVRAGTFLGQLAICLPMSALESFLQDRSPVRVQGRAARRDPGSRTLVESTLQHAQVDVSGRLPLLRLSTREVARLAPGQILHTGSTTETTIEIHVNGRLQFIGALGQVRRHIGLRVLAPVVIPEPERPGRLKEGRVL